jgi:phosphoribosylaminoimidazole-succinocarboxamide synthase
MLMSPVSAPTGSFVRSGKVRDLYAIGDDRLLLVASDRLSAFDVVLPTEIPDKGRVLTGLSRFWFSKTGSIVPNHLVGVAPEELPAEMAWDQDVVRGLRGRMMLCRRADVLPIEVIVRGYITGSGWKDYLRTGAVCGIALPEGLKESEKLPEPLFTPSTKAEVGHDENIDLEEAARLVGKQMAERVRDVAIELYQFGSAVAEPAGIILADTKFEFGIERETGELLLIDEILTPDSSRFWDAADYEPGRSQASFDKQFVRDWLETQAWDKTAPGPELPQDIVDGTRARYVEAFERITGASFDRYLADDAIDGTEN